MLCAIGLYVYCRSRNRNHCFTITITIKCFQLQKCCHRLSVALQIQQSNLAEVSSRPQIPSLNLAVTPRLLLATAMWRYETLSFVAEQERIYIRGDMNTLKAHRVRLYLY